MMEPTGADPQALTKAVHRLVQASLHDPDHPQRTPLPLVPLARALAPQRLVMHEASVQPLQTLHTLACLSDFVLGGDAVRIGSAFAGAVANQYLGWWAQWVDGLTELGKEMGTVPEVNTVSKYVDQETNLVLRSAALMTAQATAAARLMENIQVNLAWLIARHATEP